MSTPIKISLLKPNSGRKSVEKNVATINGKLNPIVLLKRLPVSKIFTEQLMIGNKEDSDSKSESPKRRSNRVSSQKEADDDIIPNLKAEIEVFQCQFCQDQSFESVAHVNEHIRSFHRIYLINCLIDSPKKVARSSLKRTAKVPDQTKSPEQITNLLHPKHQCYICALEFNLKTVLSLHLEKVHGVPEVQNEVVDDDPPPPDHNIPFPESEETLVSTGNHF